MSLSPTFLGPDPHQPECELPSLLSQSSAAAGLTQPLSIPRLIRRQAAGAPNKTAITDGGQALTYRELEIHSDRVAGQLRAAGIGRNDLVALCVPRSVVLPVAALGVMKIGAAYLPLDPAHPSGRIATLLEDANPKIVIVHEAVNHVMDCKWQILWFGANFPPAGSQLPASIDEHVLPEQRAYVVYTSGSTGRAKGVQITHGSLLNLVEWHQEAFGVGANDRASLFSSPAFDASVWEIWPYLTSGATLVVAPDEVRSDPAALRDWILSEGLTIGFVPTLIAESLLALNWPSAISLRFLLTGADTLRKFPPPNLPFHLVNNYGPSECTVVATSGIVPPSSGNGKLPTIGRPISNVQIHILGEDGQPVPQGEAGELYISGLGVGYGYLKDPEPTAVKFIPDPFSPNANGRAYRTGDLGRYTSNGEIEFFGRVDEQIKIRGYRVEPNEIMNTLAQHPAIQANVVVACGGDASSKHLVAYVVTKPGSSVTDDMIRDFLSNRLPDYMVPLVYVSVDSLPVNANGKIDRTALPPPDERKRVGCQSAQRVRTSAEERLAELVSKLLGIGEIGCDENFFMLGGHSLFATQLIARIRETFQVELGLREIFEAPTISGLAEQLERLLVLRLEAMTDEEARAALMQSARA